MCENGLTRTIDTHAGSRMARTSAVIANVPIGASGLRLYFDVQSRRSLPRMRLRVLLVTAMYPHHERPGSGAFVMHQVEQLRALGHHVDVVHVKGYVSRWNYVRGAVEVLRATWLGRYDVVHVHYGLTGLCALIRWRTPVVVTLHGSDVLQGRFQRLVSKIVATTSDAVVVVSQALANRCGGTIIPCGVDLEQFRPVDRLHARRSLRLAAAGKYVLFPFDPKREVKRYDIAAAAVALLRQGGMDVSLLPVWSVPNERMPLYYSAADAMYSALTRRDPRRQ